MADNRKGVGADAGETQEEIVQNFLNGTTTKEEAAQKLVDRGLSIKSAAALLSRSSNVAAQTKQINFDSELQTVNLGFPTRNFPDQLKATLGLDATDLSIPIEQTTRDAVAKDPSLAFDVDKLANKLTNDFLDKNPDSIKVSNIALIQTIQELALEQAKAMVAKNSSGNSGGYERYSKVAYCDLLSNAVVENPEGRVDLNKLVRYGEQDDKESDSPVFIIDAMVWIQGLEVSQYIKGSISVTLNGTDGHNTASFTLDNSNDQFVWTERNLAKFYGASAIRAGAAWVQDVQAAQAAEIVAAGGRVELQSFLETHAFTGDEQLKAQMFAYKANPSRNPPIANPKNSISFARFDLSPNRAIFSRMDPIRIFTLYPFRVPGKSYEEGNRYELWCPEFVGYVDNVAIEDDDIRGVSTITIDCFDIREGVLNPMRTSTQVMSGLAAPLDAALGFATGPTSRAGNPTVQTPQSNALQEEFRDNTTGFYNINNTAFYDDVSTNVYNQPGSHKKMEEAVYDYLVGKEPITNETNNRGVRGVTLGGNFYYNSKTTDITTARQFLEDWHKFCLFGPKRRPWTREEMVFVGEGTTTDGEFAPNKVRLWFMLPAEGTGAKNLADLSSVSNNMTHGTNWTSRLEVIKNFVTVLDYNFMVTPTGDFIVEFGMSDFRPEDFGTFKDSFRINKNLVSTQIGDEQTSPPSCLSVQFGFGDGAGAPNEIVEGQLSTIFVYSPYIAARYGIETVNESIPSLLLGDSKIAQQRAVMMYQKLLSRTHVLTMTFGYRPFLLPNRTLHHIRRSRMGAIVSVDKTFNLGVSPKGEVSCGLDHVRLFTGYYRNQDDLLTINEIQQEDIRQKGMDPANFDEMFGIDPSISADPIELQVFTTVAAGESTPSSARVGYSETSVLAPASGIYVLNLKDARRRTAANAGESVETAHEDAPVIGDTTVAIPVDTPLTNDKFRSNPIAATPLNVTSPYGPRVSPITGKPGSPHNAVDFEAANGTPLLAVEDGTIKSANSNDAKSGLTVILNTNNGYGVRYQHMDSSKPTVQPGAKVTAGTVIGYADSTGQVTGPHLHIQVYKLARGTPTLDITTMCPGPFTGKSVRKNPVTTPTTKRKV